ncbi:hypothetical protein JHK87_044829 [Glycine soja]|nr:hypothetical protein JHK87_044829 [Glycine soja]
MKVSKDYLKFHTYNVEGLEAIEWSWFKDASASIDLEELGSGSKIRGQSSSSTSVQSQRRKIGEKDGIVALMKLVAESFDRLTQAYDKKVEENDIQEV